MFVRLLRSGVNDIYLDNSEGQILQMCNASKVSPEVNNYERLASLVAVRNLQVEARSWSTMHFDVNW